MSDENLQLWREAAKALNADDIHPLDLPKAIFLGQTEDLVKSVLKYWAPGAKAPGLEKNGGRFTQEIAKELRSLRLAGLQSEAQWLLIIDPKTPSGLTAKGREALRELTVLIAYVLDDDIEEPADQQLANVKAAHAADGDTSDELSKALFDFATLAKTLQHRFAELEDEHLNVGALIDEAFQLSQSIAELPPGPQPPSQESKDALDLRNRIFALIEKRVDAIRKVARAKYEIRHPDVFREFASSYEKKRRTALARKKKQEEEEQSAKDAARQKQIDELKAQLVKEDLLAEARRQLDNEKK
jgi:hypothetical protein